MNKYDKKSLDELYAELNFLDHMLDSKKQERKIEIANKEEQLEMKYSQLPPYKHMDDEKMQELNEFKEELNEKLEINDLRNARQKVKDQIDLREAEKQM